jgi:hypothetical protein
MVFGLILIVMMIYRPQGFLPPRQGGSAKLTTGGSAKLTTGGSTKLAGPKKVEGPAVSEVEGK